LGLTDLLTLPSHDKFISVNFCLTQKTSQCADLQFAMKWNDASIRTSSQHYVTPTLSDLHKTKSLKDGDALIPADAWELRHSIRQTSSIEGVLRDQP
jgi:hypothetical protein